MIRYVIDAVRAAGIEWIVVVVGHRGDLVRKELAGERGVTFAEQDMQLGTGHAVMMCCDELACQEGPVLILAGDSPMVQASSLRCLLKEFEATGRPACWARPPRAIRPAWAGSSATPKANSWPSSRKRRPRPRCARSPR